MTHPDCTDGSILHVFDSLFLLLFPPFPTNLLAQTHTHTSPKQCKILCLAGAAWRYSFILTDLVFALNISVNTDIYINVFSFVKCWMVDWCFVFVYVLVYVYVFCVLGPTQKQDGSSQGVYPWMKTLVQQVVE